MDYQGSTGQSDLIDKDLQCGFEIGIEREKDIIT